MLYTFKKLDKAVLARSVFFALILAGPVTTFAATTPSLGMAATYGVLSSTYTNTSVTTVNGDVGFTTPPAIAPLGAQTNYGSGVPYASAGIDQAAALTALNSQPCDFIFGAATDLSLLPQPLAPGVYCVTGAQSIGTGGITLGSGTYIFRSTGALNTVANSSITGGAPCDVFWTPTATTLGANSTFLGTVIDPSGITMGAVATWVGRALAFGGTVTTDTGSITAPTCAPALATLHVIKNVVNTSGGTATPSDFMLHVMLLGIDVLGSPASGTTTPGTSYVLSPGMYVVSENANALYTSIFSGDCDSTGALTLNSTDKTCTITNTEIAPAPVISSGGGGSRGRTSISSPTTFLASGRVLGASVSDVTVPSFPNAGFPPEDTSTPLGMLMGVGALIVTLISLSIRRKKI